MSIIFPPPRSSIRINQNQSTNHRYPSSVPRPVPPPSCCFDSRAAPRPFGVSVSTRNMSQFRDNSWLANARSYGVLKSLRCSARYARAKSKSAINLNAHLKKQQQKEEEEKKEKEQQQKRKKREEQEQQQHQHQQQKRRGQSLCEDQPIYANVDEVVLDLGTSSTDDALMGNAQGQNGFEELRRYIKQGGDFSKELIFVLQERADSELIYSKSLSKLANKLNKAGREIPGSVADAWRGVATEMESRSDIHRQLAASLTDELVKPLKVVVESHHKARKAVESTVDKAARVLSEWRITEAKAKKASHTAARENEKLQDAMLDVRIQKSPSIAMLHQGPNKISAEKELKNAEKDCVKLDNKRKKAEEAVKRADVEYYTMCVRAERARVDWEMAVLRGSSQLQTNEQQRLANMHNFAQQYGRLISDINPILGGLTCRLQPQLDACNVDKDMLVVSNIRHHSEGPSEQLLPDFYCEHTTLAMNRERRKHALIKLLQLVKTDLERERKSRDGLRGLSQSLNNQENQNITDKLYHIRSMLTYLEGSRIKLQSALLELDHKPRTTHPLAQHIQITRDRTGLQQSILKVPNWLKNNDKTQQSTGLDVSGGHQEDEPEEEDACSQMMGNALSNSSCADISVTATGPALKHFNRSKSNIETFTTSQPKIISTTNASLAAVALAAASVKCKTIPANHQHNHHHNHNQGSDRGQADGGSNQQDSDFDEFSSQDEDEEDTGPVKGQQVPQSQLQSQNQMPTQHFYQNAQDLQKGGGHGHGQGQGQVLGRCKALYSYTPKLYDELELSPGDIIEVHAKQDDGWWLGALRNHIGIFPATYVEEC
ncbi:nostrin isoform X5 [Drosophila pseudoobscura]|uniref:Nostrin isoform X5 n=3 Tax=Drosophila pseudoobscura pseudoobscura TaxID=46245 RepID=A0A6I8VI87_DROPS|nr:nostrin isoform X5 [Drosophila pseudoobscura]